MTRYWQRARRRLRLFLPGQRANNRRTFFGRVSDWSLFRSNKRGRAINRHMLEIGNLEIHAWHGCNLGCESCSHYSPLGMQDGPTLVQCAQWIDAWSNRLRPAVFSILGGEPTLNRDLVRIVEHAITAFPESRI